MNATPILPADDPVSFPSLPTQRGGASRPGEPVLGRIDHYDLLRKLGGGGFGVVYLARDSVSGVEVAIKTLHPLLKTNAEEMDALREKFRLVARLTHTNIAKALVLHPVRDLNIWDEAVLKEMRLSPGDSVMVMDYAPGVTLSQWRRQFPDGIVPPDLALEIVRQLASALDYAHGERIVHRDIKPGNIMVETLRADEPRGALDHEVDAAQCAASGRQDDEKTRRQGPASETLGGRGSISRQPVIPSSRRPPHVRVRLLDFGLAAEIRSSMSRVSTETGDTSGTRPYMAPEQWLGKKQDGRTDQYALACVLYEMLSGAPPFAGVFETGDPIIMRTAVERDAPDEIEDLDSDINAALLRALSKAPKDRFPSCAAFLAALSPETRKPDIPEIRKPDADKAAPPPDAASLEADVLRRKVLVSRTLAAISEADRTDGEFGPFATSAEIELEAAKEAISINRFAAAAQCLDRAEAAWKQLLQAKERRQLREEAERKAREEAERKASEEAERKAKEEAERKIQEEAERRAREEAAHKAKEEAERKIQEEAERRRQKDEGHLPGDRMVIEITSGVELAMRWCPPTTGEAWWKIAKGDDFFWMGSPEDEKGRSKEETRHPVRLTSGFWMGETPITQAQWEAVMGSNPSYFWDRQGWLSLGRKTSPQRPVENVSWEDCQAFLERLNEKGPSGFRFVLPTEAQWEYASRAGTTGAYGGTGRLDDMGWYDSNSNNATHPVAQKKPNAWGLYDMHGNVWEWCADWSRTYPTGTATDPTGPASGAFRVLRGGSFWGGPRICRSAYRFRYYPGARDWRFGFRLLAFQGGR